MNRKQKQEFRVKIRKIKYKIDKAERINIDLKQQLQHMNALQLQQLTIDRIFRKIYLQLIIKGMSIRDWVNSLCYEDKDSLDQLIYQLGSMGIRLDNEQKMLIINWISDNLSVGMKNNELFSLIQKNGVRLD